MADRRHQAEGIVVGDRVVLLHLNRHVADIRTHRRIVVASGILPSDVEDIQTESGGQFLGLAIEYHRCGFFHHRSIILKGVVSCQKAGIGSGFDGVFAGVFKGGIRFFGKHGRHGCPSKEKCQGDRG